MASQTTLESKLLSLPLGGNGAAASGRWTKLWRHLLKSGRLPIAYKLALSMGLIVILGMGVLGTVMVTYQNELMRRQINEYGVTIASQYAASATEPVFTDDQFGLQVLTANLVSDPRILGAAIYESEGRALVQVGEVPSLKDADVSPRSEIEGGRYGSWDWLRYTSRGEEQLVSFLTPVSFKGVEAGQALVTFSRASVSHGFQRAIRALVLVTVALMLLSMGIAYWMSHRLARPIKSLVAATDELGRGNFDVHLAETRRDELGQLIEAVNRMSDSLREKQHMQGVLSRVVDDNVAKKMLSGFDQSEIGSERVEASVLFVDIVGFTGMAERATSEEVVALLNEYFAYFTQCSRLFFGTVDKFMGDCAMVIFGAPQHTSEHRFNAVGCAVVMQRLMQRLNQERGLRGLAPVRVRIGINSGEMMAGILGAQDRMEYTVVGDSVNLASRLCDVAAADEIVIGEAVYDHPSLVERVMVEPFAEVTVKGKAEPQHTYKVTSIATEHQRMMDMMINDILDHGAEQHVSKE